MPDAIQLGLLPTSSSAIISDCGQYRYALFRRWGEPNGRRAVFVALNPSTADATQDDPTLRRMRHFAERGMCTELAVVNLFAFRATKPSALWELDHDERVGPENLTFLQLQSQRARKTAHCCFPDPVILAWGAVAPPKAHRHSVERHIEAVLDIFDGCSVWCLGKTKAGMPRHPLYLPNDAPAEQWRREVKNG